MPLLIKCSSPFVAAHHPHLRAPPHVCCHVCHAHARPCLRTGWAWNCRFDLGTAAVLAQGGGVPLCEEDQPMLKEVMAENCGLVSYILTSAYFTKRVHIKCQGCPTLWECSVVCIGKNIANCSKTPQFLPVMCALCTRCARAHRHPPIGSTSCNFTGDSVSGICDATMEANGMGSMISRRNSLGILGQNFSWNGNTIP